MCQKPKPTVFRNMLLCLFNPWCFLLFILLWDDVLKNLESPFVELSGSTRHLLNAPRSLNKGSHGYTHNLVCTHGHVLTWEYFIGLKGWRWKTVLVSKLAENGISIFWIQLASCPVIFWVHLFLVILCYTQLARANWCFQYSALKFHCQSPEFHQEHFLSYVLQFATMIAWVTNFPSFYNSFLAIFSRFLQEFHFHFSRLNLPPGHKANATYFRFLL